MIRNARIYATPDAPGIERGTLVIRQGRIDSIGADLPAPPEAEVVSGEGCTVTAGFWNAHVHFTEAKWRTVRRAPPVILAEQLRDMLTARGFTTVVDTGSDPRTTLCLRRRVESGELLGPRIFTAGTGVYPPHGIPYYVRGSIPFWLRPFVPQPSSPSAALRAVGRNLRRGADFLKLFTGSYIARGTVRTMPEPIARAAADAAHAQGRLVYSHPSNLEGTQVAIRSGVDVLAHPPDSTEGVGAGVLQQMIARRMAMIPTLKMFATTVTTNSEYLSPIYEVVRRFHELGGQLLFGTDVGFMTDYSTEEEFRALAAAGLSSREILRSMTTAPAGRFGLGAAAGTLAVGGPADLTMMRGDPVDDVRAFARIEATVRTGRVIYRGAGAEAAR